VDYVVTFGSPGNVMRVAEGVDLQCADVGGQQHEVLGGGGEHVPGIEVEEGHEKVEADGRCGGDDEVCEDVFAEVKVGALFFELSDYNVDSAKGVIRHDYTVDYHGGEVETFSALGPVAHGEDELRADE